MIADYSFLLSFDSYFVAYTYSSFATFMKYSQTSIICIAISVIRGPRLSAVFEAKSTTTNRGLTLIILLMGTFDRSLMTNDFCRNFYQYQEATQLLRVIKLKVLVYLPLTESLLDTNKNLDKNHFNYYYSRNHFIPSTSLTPPLDRVRWGDGGHGLLWTSWRGVILDISANIINNDV